MSEPAKSFQHYLSGAGFRGTRQRELVVRTFFGLGRHVSANDLYREVRRRNKRIGLVTVYRTLKLLRDAGLAEERRFTRDFSLFEPKPRRHHDHMICLRCREIVEFENETIENLQEEAAQRAGFRIVTHKLELYGECKRCQARA